MYFLPGDSYICVKFCMTVELCPASEFLHFIGNIFRGFQIRRSKMVFFTISIQCNSVHLCHKQDPLMCGTAIGHSMSPLILIV